MPTFESIAAAEALLIGAVLLWSGGFKLFGRTAPLAAASSALRNLVGERHVVKVYRAVGAVELAVAAALPVTRIPAIILTLGFLGYLAYGRLKVPASSCGCSSANHSPIGWRNFALAGVLLLASLAPMGSWASAPLWTAGVLAIEAAIVIMLMPHLDRYWLFPMRRLKVRLTHPLAAATTDEIPLLASVQTLQRSDAYGKIGRLLRSDVVEAWDDGDWRMLRYTMRYRERPATAVFAVPRLGDDPGRVRLAVVDDTDDSILFSYAS